MIPVLRETTLASDHFERLYARRPDPWRLASSDYERAKYAATLAALPRARYARGFEIGCAIGVFTAELAARCDDLLAVDPVAEALAQARARAEGLGSVRFRRLSVPAEWPSERFDLIVLSEVIDYLGRADVVALADRVLDTLDPGGDMILVHWVGKKPEPSPDEASDRFLVRVGPGVRILRQERNADYRLDLLRRL